MSSSYFVAACREAQASRWGKDYVPNVPVVTHDGKVLNFYDDLIKDKIFVVSFLFTSCRDVCPIAAARMAQLQDRLGDRVGKEVFFYSISVDPERHPGQDEEVRRSVRRRSRDGCFSRVFRKTST